MTPERQHRFFLLGTSSKAADRKSNHAKHSPKWFVFVFTLLRRSLIRPIKVARGTLFAALLQIFEKALSVCRISKPEDGSHRVTVSPVIALS